MIAAVIVDRFADRLRPARSLLRCRRRPSLSGQERQGNEECGTACGRGRAPRRAYPTAPHLPASPRSKASVGALRSVPTLWTRTARPDTGARKGTPPARAAPAPAGRASGRTLGRQPHRPRRTGAEAPPGFPPVPAATARERGPVCNRPTSEPCSGLALPATLPMASWEKTPFFVGAMGVSAGANHGLGRGLDPSGDAEDPVRNLALDLRVQEDGGRPPSPHWAPLAPRYQDGASRSLVVVGSGCSTVLPVVARDSIASCAAAASARANRCPITGVSRPSAAASSALLSSGHSPPGRRTMRTPIAPDAVMPRPSRSPADSSVGAPEAAPN